MYYVKGIDEILSTLNGVLGFKSDSYTLSNSKLINEYYNFLRANSVLENLEISENLIFTDINGLKLIAPKFCVENSKFYAENSCLLQERIREGYFDKTFLSLKKQSSDLYDLAVFIIKVILINQLSFYTNGTTNDTIGLGSMDFKDQFDHQDFIELIVHQLTHMLVFLDDRLHSHMPESNKNRMINTELKFILGGNEFPAYLAFHSYIVGVEILYFRRDTFSLNSKSTYHGDTSRIIKVCNSFERALFDNLHLFTPRGQSFLQEGSILLKNIQDV